MKHSVRRTLFTLGTGVLVQRALQLVAFVVVGRTLGTAGLGVYAQGLAVAALLAVLAGAGVRNLVARAISQRPGAARRLITDAVHLRLLIGLMLATAAALVAFTNSTRPWFWLLCALHVVPAAFDLKNVADAAGRTRAEVWFESGAAALQLAAVATWAYVGGNELTVLAGISLGCRGIYAALAVVAIRALPDDGEPVRLPIGLTATGLGQTAHELLASADVALVAWLGGPAAAGYYAVALRFASAAMLPATQLARLLLPHLLHAPRRGDSQRTFTTALGATAWLTLPICAGGQFVASSLCALSGADFAAGGAVLRLLLLAGMCQQLGWQCSHALLASGRDRAYAHGLGWPALLQFLLLLALPLAGDRDAATLALLAAAAAALAQGVYLTSGLCTTSAARPLGGILRAPLLAALATAGAAALPATWLPAPAQLPAHLLLGAAGFAVALWWLELRGRIHRVGDGLATASGFDPY